MNVMVFHDYSPSPEEAAMAKLLKWAEDHQALGRTPALRIFGHNNPDPSPGTESYGYDFWLELPQGQDWVGADEGLNDGGGDAAPSIVNFKGGWYAALHHDGPGEQIPETWKRLVALLAESPLEGSEHQWLEEHFLTSDSAGPVLSIDCLAPIRRARTQGGPGGSRLSGTRDVKLR